MLTAYSSQLILITRVPIGVTRGLGSTWNLQLDGFPTHSCSLQLVFPSDWQLEARNHLYCCQAWLVQVSGSVSLGRSMGQFMSIALSFWNPTPM
jgi:hypothetical protein